MGFSGTWIFLCGAGLTLAGCGAASPQPLRPEAFIEGRGLESGILTRQTDQNGTLVYGELHAPLLPDEYTNTKPRIPTEISPRVREAIAATQPVLEAPPPPTSRVSTLPSPGVALNYQVVGTVIAVVNGKPIYADKILASLDKQLSADAQRQGPAEFQSSAMGKIFDRVRGDIQDQQYIAAANEYLTADSKAQADGYATMWRTEQVSAAGGSTEVAKEKAIRETGLSLDELVQEQRDQALIQIYMEQRVKPLIQVTPTDMRRYYEQNLAAFTQTAEAKFRLIKIDVASRGGAEQAIRAVNSVLELLRARKNFDDVAKLYNDDPNGGVVAGGAWVQKGSYVNEDVENAVWKLHPGEFTDPAVRVASQNAYYIAILDARKDGNVQPFEDTGVQRQINEILQSAQYAVLRQSLTDKLVHQSVTTETPGWRELILEMVKQRYAAWASAK